MITIWANKNQSLYFKSTTKTMFLQQSENIFMGRTSPTTISSASSWHPIQASPSEDMWELPASSSSFSSDDYGSSSPRQEFSIYVDHDDYSTSTSLSQQTPLASTATLGSNNQTSSVTNGSSNNNRSRNGLSKQRYVFGDVTNTPRSRNANNTNTRRIQRSHFN